MSFYGAEKGTKALVGATIKRIFMNEDFLKFETDKGNIVFGVYGDCCSTSIFYDFLGVKKLFGKVVTAVDGVDLLPSDIITKEGSYGDSMTDKKKSDESIQVYGVRLTTEDAEFGPVSSVFSFRNYSNGYYGGSLEDAADQEVSPEIFDDVLETAECKQPK